jgi:starch synthase
MQRLGHEVAALLPFEASAEGKTRSTRVRIPVTIGSQSVAGEVLQASGPEKLPCYLVRPGEELRPDSAARGVFHSQVAVEFARRLIPSPVVLHLFGWETALAPAYVRHSNLPFRTVLELDDVERQGSFAGEEFALTQLPTGFFSPGGVEFFGRLNFLKGGLLLAHAFTVDGWSSLTALRSEPAAHGLSAVIAEQSHKCASVRRPAQPSAWDPSTDPHISKPFSADDLAGKAACRKATLASVGTKRKIAGPVMLLDCGPGDSDASPFAAILDQWLTQDGELIVTTAGDFAPAALEAAAVRSPDRVHILRQPDEAAMHRVIAGADFQLFPAAPTTDFASAAWRAMRYGTLPLAREHAGRDEVFGADEGFVWFMDSADALWDTVGIRAAEIFRRPDALPTMRRRAMLRAAAIHERSIAESFEVLYRGLGAT